ncbi:hypothetical protein BXY85_1633 [Roseivirga pacifica]|uniref:Uncharacterized protein n=1 Tax=Roseivirga pacifica TaxID=1267423 RepID=A0A1I0MQG2_9BACT|nr:hypothetical protein [Roseivirga pacifica]MCO6359157.1 hypothetical protein [Roseivirga pacifica]MCO6365207.1 hypothetical protein [Roseivirga pacifica]MCO6372063.1 hypothetical protein [Roseivirga pacifica]MCO6375826.1 hypothetical protein [Roseivirga pacifica]MCO6379441.1 hypothetical protein [Roseivirga pacifica]
MPKILEEFENSSSNDKFEGLNQYIAKLSKKGEYAINACYIIALHDLCKDLPKEHLQHQELIDIVPRLAVNFFSFFRSHLPIDTLAGKSEIFEKRCLAGDFNWRPEKFIEIIEMFDPKSIFKILTELKNANTLLSLNCSTSYKYWGQREDEMEGDIDKLIGKMSPEDQYTFIRENVSVVLEQLIGKDFIDGPILSRYRGLVKDFKCHLDDKNYLDRLLGNKFYSKQNPHLKWLKLYDDEKYKEAWDLEFGL